MHSKHDGLTLGAVPTRASSHHKLCESDRSLGGNAHGATHTRPSGAARIPVRRDIDANQGGRARRLRNISSHQRRANAMEPALKEEAMDTSPTT